MQVPDAGVDGSNATCVEVKAQGGLSFVSRGASTPGYQPFLASNADTLSFYVKQTDPSDLGGAAIAPIPPNVRPSSPLFAVGLIGRSMHLNNHRPGHCSPNVLRTGFCAYLYQASSGSWRGQFSRLLSTCSPAPRRQPRPAPLLQVEVSIGNAEEEYYCQGQQLSSLAQGPSSDGLTQLSAPLESFNCDLSRVDQVGFQNVGDGPVAFCLDSLQLTGGSPASRLLPGASASALGSYPGDVTPLTETAST